MNLSEEFKFIGYINQYHAEGIKFDIFKKDISSETKELDGKTLSEVTYSYNKEIQESVIKKFYNRRWDELEPEYHEIKFIETEIKFLEGFSDNIKTDYRKQFNPLLKYYKLKLIIEQLRKDGQAAIERNDKFSERLKLLQLNRKK